MSERSRPLVRWPSRRTWSRVLLCYLGAALVALPVVLATTLTRTAVHDAIGISPTTFSLSTSGRSELRLGLAGTVYVPRSRGPLGLVATVDGPTAVPDGTALAAGPDAGDLAAYVSPRMLRLYSGLFQEPRQAVDGYVDLLVRRLVRNLVLAEAVAVAVGGSALLLLLRLLPPRRGLPRGRARVAAAVGTAFALACGAGWWQAAAGSPAPGEGSYPLPALDGTAAQGATTNSPVLSLLLGDAVPKVQTLVRRQKDGSRSFLQSALASLDAQAGRLTGPREGETAVLMQSDMHCNEVMIEVQDRVRRALSERFGDGVPALLAVTGDLTTNGTAAERGCVRQERAVAGSAPVVAVTGNHESELSARQMAEAGMTVLDGTGTEVAGVRLLGDGDPERTELFGGTRLRGEETEPELGRRLRTVAEDERADLVLVHEAYAAAGFLDVDSLPALLEGRGAPTERTEDDVADVPAAAVFYGHWHRSVEPRVVWNSDGTWTLVMELDTSGGAIDTPTLGHFSTPWGAPQQEASFPVVFLDEDTRLVTGYQLYRVSTEGTLTVERRVDVGDRTSGAARRP